MTRIQIHASKNYEIHIGSGLLSTAGHAVCTLGKVNKVCIVSETTVWPLYGQQVWDSLALQNLEICRFIFPAGESSKNAGTYVELLNFLARNQLTRSDLIIALGGGVVGDLAGFAAATYLRGIRFIQIPTTLLAAVDSSVGGKTAIDLPAGKNLAGAFCQPSLVICDIDTLNTLPEDVFRDGCAEVIKYAILYDPSLFETLKREGPAFDREAVIARCVELKRDVVHEDEFDTGARQMLNLGHTIGHCVEAMSHFTLSHGKSVAIGTAIVCRASQCFGICDRETTESILSLLLDFGLPITTEYPAPQLADMALSDKKRSGGVVNLIVPESIGLCAIRPTVISELESFIQAGL